MEVCVSKLGFQEDSGVKYEDLKPDMVVHLKSTKMFYRVKSVCGEVFAVLERL